MKKVLTWTIIWVVAILAMFAIGMSGIIWDKNDWIFLVLVIGLIMLNWKLNKILKLLEEKKK
jgi:NADH:ubiquinone oxidoreductase subunit K